jgi:CYTH domain-containing protein
VSTPPYEIERKYLLHEPDRDALAGAASSRSDIEQVYLDDLGTGAERVRRRVVTDRDGAERVELTHTRKVAVRAGIVEEYERTIDETEYAELLGRADPLRRAVRKTRWVVPWAEHVLEIDEVREPRRLWLLEVELDDEDDLERPITLPDWVGEHTEVTGDERYANRSIALPD